MWRRNKNVQGGQRPQNLIGIVAHLVAAAFLMSCNPGGEILALAQQSQAIGNDRDALRAIDELLAKHPKSDAAVTGKSLAVDWLLEKARREKDPEARSQTLERALRYDSDHGRANLELCRAQFDEGNLARAEACVNELSTKIDVPPDQAAKLAQAIKEQVEIRTWLNSGDRQDWGKVARKYPGTESGLMAKSWLEKAASLCHDLQSWVDAPRASLTEINANEHVIVFAVRRAAKEKDMRVFGKAHDGMRATKERAGELAKDIRSKLSELPAHEALPGEEEVQDNLIYIHRVAVAALNKYHEHFGSVTTLHHAMKAAEAGLDMIQPAENSIRNQCKAILSKKPAIPGLDAPIASNVNP